MDLNTKLEFTFPNIPPSNNSCYRSYNGRVIKSKRLLEYRKEMTEFFEAHVPFKRLEGDLSLNVTFNLKGKRSIDLDNLFKALLDSLEHVCFENDKQIVELIARKTNNNRTASTDVILKEINNVLE